MRRRAAGPGPLAALAAALLALAGCDKFQYLPDNPVQPIRTQVLMHGGCGNDPGCTRNTLAGVLYGCGVLDGAEMDLQLSADDTLWLGHDNDLTDCSGAVLGCFQNHTDAEISALAVCNGVTRYTTLEAVLAAVKPAYPQKLLSFDIKGQYCTLREARDFAKRMAEEVDRLVRAYGFDGRVMTESDQDPFLQRIQELATPVHSLVVSLGDIDAPLSQAASLGAAGISFKYAPTSEPLNADVVAGIHRKGFRFAVWTIDGQADAQAVWAMGPDVIETDDGIFYSYLPLPPNPLGP